MSPSWLISIVHWSGRGPDPPKRGRPHPPRVDPLSRSGRGESSGERTEKRTMHGEGLHDGGLLGGTSPAHLKGGEGYVIECW